MSRIVTIDIRVRVRLPDAIPLNNLMVDSDLDVPLKYVEVSNETNVSVTRLLPKVLTVQHGMHEDTGRQFEPLGSAIEED
jgi:hypothetical protein